MIYFFASLLANVLILSIYTVQLAIEHNHCATSNGNNITDFFEIAFKLGFTILIMDTVNTHCLYIYYRFKH